MPSSAAARRRAPGRRARRASPRSRRPPWRPVPAGTGRIETTTVAVQPPGGPARPGRCGTSARCAPCSMCRIGTPASTSGASNVKLQPIRNVTRSSRQQCAYVAPARRPARRRATPGSAGRSVRRSAPGGERRRPRTGLGDVQQRARLRVALGRTAARRRPSRRARETRLACAYRARPAWPSAPPRRRGTRPWPAPGVSPARSGGAVEVDGAVTPVPARGLGQPNSASTARP